MDIQLLDNEFKKHEIALPDNVLTLTNKRLIHTNTLNQSKDFIRLDELRSVDATTMDIITAKLIINDPQLFIVRLSAALGLLFGFYMAFEANKSGGEFWGFVFLGFLGGGILAVIPAVIIYLLLNFYAKQTSKTIKRARLSIKTKTDAFFLNTHYDITKLDALIKMEKAINNAIYDDK